MSSIVIFYSRADENYFGGSYRYIEVGNTEKAAKMISQINGADLFKLEQVKPYSKDYQACIAEAKKDLQNNARPELKTVPARFPAAPMTSITASACVRVIFPERNARLVNSPGWAADAPAWRTA